MGLLGAIGNGLAEAGGAAAKIGMEQIRAAIEADRDARLNEMRSNADLTTRARNKDDAAAERARVAEFAKPVESQPNGLIAQGAGANDADAVGADESIGRDVQKRARAPSIAESSAAALKAGDLKSAKEIASLDDKDAANAIKLQIAQGRFENAIQIAQMKGEFGMMLGELRAASKGGNEKATELMRNWEYLKSKGKTDQEAGDLLLSGKVGEYVTVSEKSVDDNGKETTITRKQKPGSALAPAKKVVKFGDLK